MAMLQNHVLSLLIALPLLAGAITFFLSVPMARVVTLVSTVASFALSLWLWVAFDGSTSQVQFFESYAWMPDYGVRYLVGVDGLSLLLVVLTGFLGVLVSVYQMHGHDPREGQFHGLMLLLQAGMFGSLVSLDIVLFYLFWEAMLIPMYFIIGLFGGPRRVYATTKFVIYTVAGSFLLLIALIVLYVNHYEQFGVYSASLLDLYRVRLAASTQFWLFVACAIGFAIKIPLWPLHTWLPDAHVEAPTVGSVILAGVLLKLGTYGLLRFALPLFPEAATLCAPYLAGLGVIGIIYGSLMAWVQPDAKKLVAFSSVAHLGFVVVGSVAVVGGVALSPEALTGAVYQMINHGLATGALFFLVGMIYERRHTRMLADFGGLAKNMPVFATVFIIVTLGSVGLPGTGGFIGEFLILLGAFQASPVIAILSGLGVLLGAVYMLTLARRLLFGPLSEANKNLSDLDCREKLVVIPLAVLIIVTGIVPNLFMGKTMPSIDYLAQHYQQYRLDVASPKGDIPAEEGGE
jgi:NADH-quinone oxidoreductase subunit M